ncbi:MAG: sortase [Actinomycetota bacterium]|nr:sortase [Actinomycetota bacterium]
MSKWTTLAAALVLMVLASAAPALAQQEGGDRFVVESGDTLSGVAEELYDDAERWEALFEANRDRIGDPDRIFPGQVLRVPSTDEGPTATPSPRSAAPEDAPPAPVSPPEEEAAPAPSGTAMSLSVPALGVSGVPVIDENSEAALTAGAMHLPGTGFPWQGGANTYIAGHRVGYPGTPSDRVFYDLPSISMGDEVLLTDADGRSYTYAVTEVFAVSPSDTWVTAPVEGRDVVTLQTCTESVDDWTTIGPRLMASGPDSGRLIVRADRVS